MTLNEIWKIALCNPRTITILVVLFMSLIEVSKIKINPWSSVGKLIGKFLGINALSDKVGALDKKVDVLDKKVEENDVISARVRILRFASEVQDRRYHNKDSWDQTMVDIAKYEKYVIEHPDFKNGITEPTIEYIKDQYKERLEKHDWERKQD